MSEIDRTEAAPGPSSAPHFRLFVRPWEMAVLVGVSLLMVLVHMNAFTAFSPFDEATHVDYVVSIADLDAPVLGEPYDDETLRAWSCRGFFNETFVLPPCDSSELDHTLYPGQGVQRNSTPPVYYAITAAVAKPIATLAGVNIVSMARLTGVLFLSAGLISCVGAARRLGADRWISLLVIAVVPFGIPTVLHATSTVNSDAGVFAIGGLAIFAALAALDREIPLWSLPVLGIVAGLTKQTALFPVGAAAILMILATLWPDEPVPPDRRRRQLMAAITMPVAGAVSFLAWTGYVETTTPEDFVNPIGTGGSTEIVGLPFDEIVRNPLDLLLPTETNFVPQAIRTAWQQPWAHVLGVFVIAAAALAVTFPGRLLGGDRAGPATDRPQLLRAAGWGLIIAGVASALAIQTYLALGRGTYFPRIPSRYSIGSIPLALALISVLLGGRPGRTTNSVVSLLIVGSVVSGTASLLI